MEMMCRLKRSVGTTLDSDNDGVPQSWQQRVVEASKLIYDTHTANYEINEAALPVIPQPPVQLSILKRVVNKVRRVGCKAINATSTSEAERAA